MKGYFQMVALASATVFILWAIKTLSPVLGIISFSLFLLATWNSAWSKTQDMYGPRKSIRKPRRKF